MKNILCTIILFMNLEIIGLDISFSKIVHNNEYNLNKLFLRLFLHHL